MNQAAGRQEPARGSARSFVINTAVPLSVFNATEFCHFFAFQKRFIHFFVRQQAAKGTRLAHCEVPDTCSLQVTCRGHLRARRPSQKHCNVARYTKHLSYRRAERSANEYETCFVKTAENSKFIFFGNLFHSPDVAA